MRYPLILIALVSLFWGSLLVDANRIPHWDAIDYHYPYQKHFSDSVRAGRLPFWTSTIFSGFPFLADLQVGAWYPLNWPFFAAGISPKSMFGELWLHALLAALGTYLFALRRVPPPAALLMGLIYSLSGFFVAHSQHIGMFQTAAWLPLLLYLIERYAAERRASLVALAILTSGCVCLAGHFQTALYIFTAAGLYAVFLQAFRAIVVITLGGLSVAAIQLLPATQLLAHSIRSQFNPLEWKLGLVGTRSLATFFWPNAAGAFDSAYSGPPDITQHYFYSGMLLVPLALAGLRSPRRWLPVALVLIPVLYSLGPASPLYGAITNLPGFASVRGPSHALFLTTFGLALLAARAVAARPGLALILAAVFFIDLTLWNLHRSPFPAARGTYAALHAPSDRWFREIAGLPLPPLTRLAAPGKWSFFYPAMSPFSHSVETTFGSNPLMLSRYYDYLRAMERNPSLMAALGVSRYFFKEWESRPFEMPLPRFHSPPRLLYAPNPAALLPGQDSASTAVISGAQALLDNPPAKLAVDQAAEDRYSIRVTADARTFVRIGIPYYPGWTAALDGNPVPILPADHALMGLFVPGGPHLLHIEYRERFFLPGAILSLAATLACVATMALRFFRT